MIRSFVGIVKVDLKRYSEFASTPGDIGDPRMFLPMASIDYEAPVF